MFRKNMQTEKCFGKQNYQWQKKIEHENIKFQTIRDVTTKHLDVYFLLQVSELSSSNRISSFAAWTSLYEEDQLSCPNQSYNNLK